MAKGPKLPDSTFVTIARFLAPVSAFCFMTMCAGFVLLCTPGALTKFIPPIHRLRNYLLRQLYYYWQLSLEGPLFKLIGFGGKKLAPTKLASLCKVPKAFKVKVLTICEMDAAWTPQLPDNPFHEEHYVLSYCQMSEAGEAGAWVERMLTDGDFHKKKDEHGRETEKPKEIGKAQRKRLMLTELPENSSFRLRICAEGANGRSPWSPEVPASTFARPHKDMGHMGPLARTLPKWAPTAAREYRWWQSKHEVGLTFAIPEDWKAKEVNVKVTPTEFRMSHVQGNLLTGTLGGPVKADEVDWTIESTAEGKHIQVTLRKEKLMQQWECFVDAEGHPHIDTALLQLLENAGNSMNELASQDLWT